MNDRKLKIGISQGDINGIGLEVILKTFSNPAMFELCTPIIYGSPKVTAYHRKSCNISTNFSIINSVSECTDNTLSVLNCVDDEVRVEFAQADRDAGKSAFMALERAVEDLGKREIDVLVTAPINKEVIHSKEFPFMGHTEYIEERLGKGRKSLMLLLKDDFRMALATNHIPISQIAETLTLELLEEKIHILNESLKFDFGIERPRIAVLALNPHAGDGGLIGEEEKNVIISAIKNMSERGVLCYGPYPADGFMGAGTFSHFDAILAMYHDQGLAPFKALFMDEGVNFTAGLPVVRTSPAHGVAYDIAGKGMASEDSFRQAVYTAIDIYRNREQERESRRRPLRKQYYDHRDDSDQLKLDSVDDE